MTLNRINPSTAPALAGPATTLGFITGLYRPGDRHQQVRKQEKNSLVER